MTSRQGTRPSPGGTNGREQERKEDTTPRGAVHHEDACGVIGRQPDEPCSSLREGGSDDVGHTSIWWSVPGRDCWMYTFPPRHDCPGEGNERLEGHRHWHRHYGQPVLQFVQHRSRLYLQEKGRSGADLAWTPQANNFMKVKRITLGSGPIKCGELVGVFVEEQWMISAGQTYSINISTKKELDPNNVAHKWQFTNCQAAGGVVPLNTPVGLFSMKEDTHWDQCCIGFAHLASSAVTVRHFG